MVDGVEYIKGYEERDCPWSLHNKGDRAPDNETILLNSKMQDIRVLLHNLCRYDYQIMLQTCV